MKIIIISIFSLVIFPLQAIVRSSQSRINEKETVKKNDQKNSRTRNIICKNAPRFKSRKLFSIISTQEQIVL